MGVPPIQGLNRRIHNHNCPKCGDRIPNPTKSARMWNGYCGHCYGWLRQQSNKLTVDIGNKGD